MELKKRLEKLLAAHTKKAVVLCDASCMCWEIEALLCDLDMQSEKSVQHRVRLGGLTVAALDNLSKRIKKVVGRIEARTARR